MSEPPPATEATAAPPTSTSFLASVPALLPGLLLCVAGAAAATWLGPLLPGRSAMLVAIVLGMVLTNVVKLPASTAPGLAFAAKRVLRVGIVLLGFSLVLGDLIGLGPGILVLVVVVVAGGILGSLLIGRWLGIPPAQRLLVACGVSICGAAAVAAVDGVTEAEEEDVATAISIVVAFGTLMIALIPALAALFGFDEHLTGVWIGASTHEVAQVVAAGGAVGGLALSTAVSVKLGRVLMLGPVLAVLSWKLRRDAARAAELTGVEHGSHGARPPLVPLFVVGFLALTLLRSFTDAPAGLVDAVGLAQRLLLVTAMFALGCGVRFTALKEVGLRPILLGTLSTTLVLGIGLGGTLLVA